jgi:acyl-[acyl-carrier-protein] desaturase
MAMLDRATEDALYAHFTAFFRRAEEERRWNLWNDVPWDQVNPAASAPLTEAVEAAYAEELFLPDYAARMIRLLRSSRGRVWFLTRWTYEEGKHILALGEWLVRAGKRSDDALKELADRLLAEGEWKPAFPDPLSAIAQAMGRERGEIERYRGLLARATAEGDGALVSVLKQMLADEEEHLAFFRDALQLIRERHPGVVEEALSRVGALPTAG